jgi:hypothetical protein
MTFRYRGFRVVIADAGGGLAASAGYLFDPMTPGALCVSTDAQTPAATAQYVCRYIDELCAREGQEVLDQLVAK